MRQSLSRERGRKKLKLLFIFLIIIACLTFLPRQQNDFKETSVQNFYSILLLLVYRIAYCLFSACKWTALFFGSLTITEFAAIATDIPITVVQWTKRKKRETKPHNQIIYKNQTYTQSTKYSKVKACGGLKWY